jgi:hypothetical protein
MDKEIILALIGLFGGIVTLIVKSYMDRKATKKDLTSRDKNISDRLVNIENLFTQLDMKLEILLHDNNFRDGFKNTLRIKMNSLIKAGMVDGINRNILSLFQTFVEDFGLKFYYSGYRKTSKKDLENYLNNEYQTKKDTLTELINSKYEYPRYNGSKKIYFTELLKLSKINAASETLIFRLCQNGFTPDKHDELVKLFEDYTETVYFQYMQTFQLWNTYREAQEDV